MTKARTRCRLCARPVRCKGLCAPHYQAAWRRQKGHKDRCHPGLVLACGNLWLLPEDAAQLRQLATEAGTSVRELVRCIVLTELADQQGD